MARLTWRHAAAAAAGPRVPEVARACGAGGHKEYCVGVNEIWLELWLLHRLQ